MPAITFVWFCQFHCFSSRIRQCLVHMVHGAYRSAGDAVCIVPGRKFHYRIPLPKRLVFSGLKRRRRTQGSVCHTVCTVLPIFDQNLPIVRAFIRQGLLTVVFSNCITSMSHNCYCIIISWQARPILNERGVIAKPRPNQQKKSSRL